jgi:alcohol dehydrogenase
MSANAVSKFCCCQIVHHGPGALDHLADEIRKFGAARPALVTDPGVVRAGLADRVRQAAGLELALFAQAEPEPPYPTVHACAEFLQSHGCDAVIGLGGGSSMDTAKMAAALATNGGVVSDYWGLERVPKPGLPVIAIPTTAGTGSEVSPAAVFKDPTDHTKKGVRSDHLLARAAILDPTLTLGLPPALTAATGMDALIHAVEAYTSPRATLISDAMAEQAIRLIGEHLRTAYRQGDALAARSGMLTGSFLAGLALAEVNVGAVHALAQALGGRYSVSHGVANSLFLPHVMAFNRPSCRPKYARVAAWLGEKVEGLSVEEASLRAIDAVSGLLKDLGLPRSLRAVGVPSEALSEIAEACMRTQGRNLTNNARPVSLQDAEAVLRAAY